MVSVLMKGYDLNHDIYELLKVFFPNEDINQIHCSNDYTEGILIDFTLEKIGDSLYGVTKQYNDKKLLSDSKENIDDIYIKRNKEKSIRIGVKKSLYNAIISTSEKEVPWGILTGIRPSKIVHELMEKDTSKEVMMDILTKEYKLSSEKANLIIDISYKQMQYLYPVDRNKYSLYVGIPFCPTRCIYCSFASLPVGKYNKYIDEYVEKLIYEIKSIKRIMSNKKINTVYIGGGTPTSIPVNSLKSIIESIYDCFGIENINEFTVEAGRPDTINYEVLKMLREQNITRISINPQTMNDKTLKLIGRNHTSEDIIRAYRMARDVGFTNINMDLIAGLPGEGIPEMKNTLIELERLDPENITIHTLAVKRGSEYKEHRDNFDIKNQDLIKSMLKETRDYASKNNLEPYYLYRQKQILGNAENIGYSKPGYECIYNISIMEEKETIIGAGVGSTTKIYEPNGNKLERIFNFKDLKEYINRIDELIDRKRKLFK